MGNLATTIGDNLTWLRSYQNVGSVNGTLTTGTDLDDAVLVAINKII